LGKHIYFSSRLSKYFAVNHSYHSRIASGQGRDDSIPGRA